MTWEIVNAFGDSFIHSFIHLILHGHRGQPGPIDQSAHNKLVAFSNEAHGRAEMVGLVLAL